MNKILITLIGLISLIISSCSSKTNKTEELQKNFEQVRTAMHEGEQSPIVVKDLPFGLQFGMTLQQADTTLQQYVERGEMKKLKANQYSLDYKIGDLSFNAFLEFGFYENVIYILKITSTYSAHPDAALFENIREVLADELSSWKRIDYILMGTAEESTNIWTDWFNENMEIQLAFRFGDIDIVYSNLPIKKILSDAETERIREEVQAERAAGPASKVENSSWDGSVRQVEKYLKDNLKDPGSYESIEWSEVQKDGNKYKVRHKYRAKNSYGGYVISNQVFTINRQGKVINVVDI